MVAPEASNLAKKSLYAGFAATFGPPAASVKNIPKTEFGKPKLFRALLSPE